MHLLSEGLRAAGWPIPSPIQGSGVDRRANPSPSHQLCYLTASWQVR